MFFSLLYIFSFSVLCDIFRMALWGPICPPTIGTTVLLTCTLFVCLFVHCCFYWTCGFNYLFLWSVPQHTVPCLFSDYTTMCVYVNMCVCCHLKIYTHNHTCSTVSVTQWWMCVFLSVRLLTDKNTHLFVVLSHVSWHGSLMKPTSFWSGRGGGGCIQRL